VKSKSLLGALLPALILSFWIAGCTRDSTNASLRPGDPGYARNTGVQMTIAAGDGQTGMAGQPLPDSLVVRVLDQLRQPVADGVVNWKVMSGGGAVSQRATTTDAQGYARTEWTLGTLVGAQTVRAAGVGGTVVFTATAGETAPLLQKVSGDSQSAQAGQKLAAPLVVRAVDAAGRPLRGIKLNWRVLAGGGSVLRGAGRTDADGTASAEWVVGTPGPQELRVAANDAAPVRFTATATPVVPPPPALPVSMHVIPNPIWLAVGDTGRIRVVFLDAQGNVVPGPKPTFISFSSYATVSESGLVRATVASNGGIEVRAWPFRRFVSVNAWSPRQYERYGSPRNWLYVVPEVTNMFIGDTEQLNALWVDGNGTVTNARDAEWSSWHPAVSVSSTGLATAVSVSGSGVVAKRGDRTAISHVGVSLRGGWCCRMLFDGMTITPAVVSAGAADGVVHFGVYYRHDGPTRLARFSVRVRGPDGRILEQTWHAASGSMTIPRGSPPGRYDIVRVQLVSNGEHVNDVYPSQLESLNNPTHFTVTN
jgi:hypothetical protein